MYSKKTPELHSKNKPKVKISHGYQINYPNKKIS